MLQVKHVPQPHRLAFEQVKAVAGEPTARSHDHSLGAAFGNGDVRRERVGGVEDVKRHIFPTARRYRPNGRHPPPGTSEPWIGSATFGISHNESGISSARRMVRLPGWWKSGSIPPVVEQRKNPS